MSEFIHSSFRLLLEIYHLECQHFQDQETPLYQQMLQRVISMPWQIKARYVPLCAIVPYMGSQQVGKAGVRGVLVSVGSAAEVAQPLSTTCRLLPSSAVWAGSLPTQRGCFSITQGDSIPGVVSYSSASLGSANGKGSFACQCPPKAGQKQLEVPEMLSARGDCSVACTHLSFPQMQLSAQQGDEGHLPFSQVLDAYPDLPQHLLSCLSTNHLCPAAAEVYKVLVRQQCSEWRDGQRGTEVALAEQWAL